MRRRCNGTRGCVASATRGIRRYGATSASENSPQAASQHHSCTTQKIKIHIHGARNAIRVQLARKKKPPTSSRKQPPRASSAVEKKRFGSALHADKVIQHPTLTSATYTMQPTRLANKYVRLAAPSDAAPKMSTNTSAQEATNEAT